MTNYCDDEVQKVEKPYVEFLVGYRYETEFDADLIKAQIYTKAFPGGELTEEEGRKVSRGEPLVTDHGMILIQDCKEPKKWGIICINKEYRDKYFSIIAKLDQPG